MVTDIYIARNTEPIVLSSLLFLVPVIYSYYIKFYFYTVVSFVTFFISANYWRKATIGFRRDLDLVFSKISFLIYVTSNLIYLHYNYPLLLGYKITNNSDISTIIYITSYSNLFLIVYFYNRSYYYYKLNDIRWMRNHMLFHLFCNINILLIIYLGNYRFISNIT
jgi:hypothetical protein